MKPGCAFIAAHTQKPVVPMAIGCTNGWRISGSWTDLLIPKPFSTVYAIAGVPIALPQGATKADLVRATRAIQSEMDRLNEIAERLAAGESLDTYGLIRQIPSDLTAAA